MATSRFHNPMSRRGFLTVGALGLGGLTMRSEERRVGKECLE